MWDIAEVLLAVLLVFVFYGFGFIVMLGWGKIVDAVLRRRK